MYRYSNHEKEVKPFKPKRNRTKRHVLKIKDVTFKEESTYDSVCDQLSIESSKQNVLSENESKLENALALNISIADDDHLKSKCTFQSPYLYYAHCL